MVCFNVIGSCYGSTSAASLDPATGKPYGGSFPQVTVRDWVRAQKIALAGVGNSASADGDWAVDWRHAGTAMGGGVSGVGGPGGGDGHDPAQRAGAGTEPSATRGHPAGSGMARRRLLRRTGTAHGIGAGTRAGDVHLQVGGAVPRPPRTQGRPQGDGAVGVRRRGDSILRAIWNTRGSCSGSALTPMPT